MTESHANLSDEDLQRFREVQQLAYRCAEAIGARLTPGTSERQAAAHMKTWLLDHGVDDWFHQPFAWFGDRTAFRGFIGVRHMGGFNPAFYPGNRVLEENMPFILDCAPSMGGYTADIGYCGVVGENKLLDRLMDDLMEHRQLILDLVKKRTHLSQVSQAVDRLCARQGVEPRHKAYPFQVLAHRVEKLADDGEKQHTTIMNFGVRNISELIRDRVKGLREGWSPLWSSGHGSDHPPTPGLWAVEPHLGFRDVGAKWEELLVVTEDDAFWLDDDVPHVRRWMQRGLWQQQAA
ncbi:MAG TPA: M24 family metallopeptidase [Stenotrophobium sp.]|jgi:Xaa-Pro aminopeptidase|nr:M24 family metallopeptidase [Stenotrophobium sp.]